MNLQPKQFKPAHLEGKAASDWLSTPQGHTWQTKKFSTKGQFGGTGSRGQVDRGTRINEFTRGLFTVKPDREFADERHDYWEGSQTAYNSAGRKK